MIITNIILALLYFLAFLLILIAIVCIVPFSYSAFFKVCDEKVSGRAAVRWGFGFIGANLSLGENKEYQLLLAGRPILTRSIELKGILDQSDVKDTEVKSDKKKKTKKKRKKFNREDISIRELAAVIKDTFSKLIRILRPKHFRWEGIYGFDDPSITGLIEAIASILRSRLNRVHISLQPCFHEGILDMEMEMSGRMSLISLIALVISTLVKKPVRKLIFPKKNRSSKKVKSEDLPSS